MNKLDAARRQLLAAIHIHWYLKEPLAVYSLATNAWEISNTLLEKADRLRMIREIAESQGSTPRQIKDLINLPRNFIKHADRDPDATQPDITDTDCDAMLETACIDYMMAAGRSHIIMGIYLAWYSAIFPEKVGSFLREAADLFFPNLFTMPRADQILAARKAASQPIPSNVLNAYRNELTDNHRWTALRSLGQNLPTG
ncbi:hypothetical protein CU102_12285 [Phyllobacterium brassicacearum]|uniref:Uncharacterized protein n=1 Tax=Phyllobacterium brassicacearum TaxID=314235 RepID=A0A2P7BPY3_9HYPH|nr:hypothetical protein [Phyllobacterium brassicacearum]PSH68537.1 hypothetical protein CU102_12285 [Phyllobacterium brassicacearum]TDQ19880.1 hypothetical protein DEV91_12475 [Phyllobacterium brassicacearum]